MVGNNIQQTKLYGRGNSQVMGRKRKYHTEKERQEAQRKWQMDHYLRNKEKIKQKARDKYREQKRRELYEKKVNDLYGELDI